MPIQKTGSFRVHFLKDSVAKRLAAGEVIDRPLSIIREGLDNSIDAGADKITVEIEKGGSASVRISDNGRGMSKEDLEICCLPQTTSKISEIEDLQQITSLGFRGEALASIAACSRLDIISREKEAASAFKLSMAEGKVLSLKPCQGTIGTILEAKDLFYNIPARKHFLKSASAESRLCSQLFLEKALAFPEREFRFFADKKLKYFLRTSSWKQRIEQTVSICKENLLDEISAEESNFSFTLFSSGPHLQRKDRKYIQIYINKRRVQEFALVQAIEYAFTELLPGGIYPYAFLFLEINPSLIDFNIHPAKREVKIQCMQEIRRSLISQIRNYYGKQVIKKTEEPQQTTDFFSSEKTSFAQNNILQPKPTYNYQNKNAAIPGFRKSVEYAKEESRIFQTGQPAADTSGEEFNYLGQIMGVFLLVEKNTDFYIVDQHAAHERLLYEEIINSETAYQNLLIPFEFETSAEEETLLIKEKNNLKLTGFLFEQIKESYWQLNSIPVIFRENIQDCITIILNAEWQEGKDLYHQLASGLACKKAIKDGTYLDYHSALELLKKIFKLNSHTCPHGRPFLYKLRKQDLFKIFKRKI